MELTISTSKVTGNAKNCVYPTKHKVCNKQDMVRVIQYDHVCALFQNNYRSKENFMQCDCDVFDCDNDHSDNPNDWIYPEDYEYLLEGVSYIVVPSRNNMKEKNNKTARPRHHVYFPHRVFQSASECELFKRQVQQKYPFFDHNALDAVRFIYGSTEKDIIWSEGSKLIDDILDDIDLFEELDNKDKTINEGSRNATMSHVAGKLVKRYGNTDESYQLFLEEACKCVPPLDDSELKTIWYSAVKFGKKVASQEGYIPSEQYHSESVLKPSDYSDVGQAMVMATEYRDVLCYSPSADFMIYNGSYWEESKPKSQGIAQQLTDRQLEEAEIEVKKRVNELVKYGVMELLANTGVKKAKQMMTPIQLKVYELYEAALEYKKYAIKRRDSKYITATLKEVRPMIEVEQNQLDIDEFLLNTPSYTYDLKDTKAYNHKSSDYITKQTAVDPSEEGLDIWTEALETFFQQDQDLIDYVQKIVGLASIGKVYVEALIIAYGEGRNGKSTFWNVIARVLGSYSGNISADMLTVGCRRNVKPELAEAKGKRLLIAAELEEGMRLNTSNVKQLCSTDEIYAEKKYKDPFSYVPTHTLVLYTNHLPRVGAIDKGTWRRLIVIPFNAKIEGQSDIKNYSDYLFEKAGGAILSWIMTGAKKVIQDNYHITPPQKVQEAINAYKESNDWFSQFLEECCELDKTYTEKSGELYTEYRAYCLRNGEYTRSTTDFYATLEQAGFDRKRNNKGNFVLGLRLKSEFL